MDSLMSGGCLEWGAFGVTWLEEVVPEANTSSFHYSNLFQ